MDQNRTDTRYRTGTLPEQAPLAMAYVPMQRSADVTYDADTALARGTLFPGLDLPFMDLVNGDLPATPKTEMMAIDFVVDELELYLDTHANDREAFDLYQTPEFQADLQEHITTLWNEARKLQAENPDIVQFVRGIGMSMGIGIGRKAEDGTMVPDPDATFKILYRCYEKGLIVISLGANVLRIQPPLVITSEQLKTAFGILAEAIADFRAGKISDDVLAFRAGW